MILKAKQKAKLLVEVLWCHTSHKSSYSVLLFFLHRALIQQSVNAGEKLAFIKKVTKMTLWSPQRPDWPAGHHWWPFSRQQWSGGYCVALKWQGCEVTDEKVNTQRSWPFARWKRGEFVVTWVLYFSETVPPSWNLRLWNVSMSKSCHMMSSFASVIQSWQQWHDLIFTLCASEDLQLSLWSTIKEKMIYC